MVAVACSPWPPPPAGPDSVRSVGSAAEGAYIRKQENAYVIVDERGKELTEREFARRYASATGSHELDRVDRPWGTEKIWILAGGLAVGAAVITAGAVTTERPCTAEDLSSPAMFDCRTTATDPKAVLVRDYGYYSLDKETAYGTSKRTLLDVGIVFTTLWSSLFGGFVLATYDPEGRTKDHRLPEADARVAVERYNRARRHGPAAVDSRPPAGVRQRPESGVRFTLGPAGVQCTGTF